MSRLLIKNNSSGIDIINTFIFEFKNNNRVSIIDDSIYEYSIDFLQVNGVENIKGNISINGSTLISKQSICDYSSSIISDSQYISSFDFNINNFSTNINTITLSYNSNIYTCSSKVVINNVNFYIFDLNST